MYINIWKTRFGFWDRDWNDHSIIFKSETETEILSVSLLRLQEAQSLNLESTPGPRTIIHGICQKLSKFRKIWLNWIGFFEPATLPFYVSKVGKGPFHYWNHCKMLRLRHIGAEPNTLQDWEIGKTETFSIVSIITAAWIRWATLHNKSMSNTWED